MRAKEEVITIKLVTGDELIAVKIEDDGFNIRIDSPYSINYSFIDSGVVMQPWCFWSDDKVFTLGKDKVIYVASCTEKIADKYLDLLDQLAIKQELKDIKELNETVSKIEALLNPTEKIEYEEAPIFIEGNKTKH